MMGAHGLDFARVRCPACQRDVGALRHGRQLRLWRHRAREAGWVTRWGPRPSDGGPRKTTLHVRRKAPWCPLSQAVVPLAGATITRPFATGD
jgi:hypothetical protein